MARGVLAAVGCGAVVALASLIGLAMALGSTGAFDRFVGKGVEVAHTRASSLPQVSTVESRVAWLDDSWIRVHLASHADDVSARDVWCDVLIPTDVRLGLVLRGDYYWPSPEDCDDPSDVPAARLLPADRQTQ